MITEFSKSNALCEKAQALIPGGAHTYSKGPDQSPALGPKLIARGSGSHVWDVDGNEYVDWTMGLASVSLGHAYEPVLDAVRAELPNGSNFQCPSPIESELAEHFLSLLPGADMVKFAKNGSTVTTAALKLARAHTGRKLVAFCEDHGFFSYDDWYIGKKPNNSGVPEEISALSLTFRYNDIGSVERLFQQHPKQIACLILEPMEFDRPKDGFLNKVQELCRREGALFILDEMITGFRLGWPGVHGEFGLDPDLTTWGKGVANGFSTCVLAGKRDIMELGGLRHDKDRVFLISTTHGAETHSLAAALATLREMKRTDSINRIRETGRAILREVESLLKSHRLEGIVTVKGDPAWQLMQFRDAKGQLCDGFKTLLFQEMVKNGVFFRGLFLPTISHGKADVDVTLRAFDSAFKVYRQALEQGTYRGLLTGDPVKPVFRKRN